MKTIIHTAISCIVLVLVSASTGHAQYNWTKDPNNPVLRGVGSGNWNSRVFMPAVLYNPDSSRYEMWHGASFDAFRPFKLGFAHSEDGINWTTIASPVLDSSRTSFDKPTVVYDNGTYRMWFNFNKDTVHAYNSWSALWSIGMASSDDGINWTVADVPVFEAPDETSGYLGCTVIKPENGNYRMWYHYYSGTAILVCAESHDGVEWTVTDTTDFTDGAWGSWDQYPYFGSNSVIYRENTYYMFYSGSYGDTRSIGLITSEDGIHWERSDNPYTTDAYFSQSDPVFISGGGDGFNLVESPCVLLEGDSIRMWFSANGSGNPWCIAHAWSHFGPPEYTNTPGEAIDGEDVRIYPNPAGEYLVIETSSSDLSRIEIYTLTGQLVHSREVNGSVCRVDLSGFEAGVYWATVRTNEYTFTRKIIKL